MTAWTPAASMNARGSPSSPNFTLSITGRIRRSTISIRHGFIPDQLERAVQVAQRGDARALVDDLPPFPLRLPAVAVDRRRDILNPIIVLDPVVQSMFGQLVIVVAPQRGSKSFSMRRARARKLCPLPGTCASAASACWRSLAMARSA